MSNNTKILTLDEIKSIFLKYNIATYITSSEIYAEWIDFQHKAMTVGVTEFDIDMMILDSDALEIKYGK